MNKQLEIMVQEYEEPEMTELDERDCDYNRWYLSKVFAGTLHEKSVYDKCELIFRRTFRPQKYFII